MQKNVHRNKKIYTYAAGTISTILLLLSAKSGNPYYELLFYAILPIGLVKPEYLFPPYFIASLSSNYFVAAQGVGMTRLMALIIIIGVLIRIVKNRKSLRKKWIINCLLIAATTIISFLLAYDNDATPLFVLGLNILIMIAVTNLSLNETEVFQVFRAILISVLITTVYYGVEYSSNPYFLQNARLTIAEGINENRFAMMMAQLSAYSMAYLYFTKKTIIKAICLSAGIANSYFVLLSGSRSALIGIILGFGLAILISSYKQRKIKKRAVGIILFSTLLIVASNAVIETNPMLAHRMNLDTVVSSQGTRRWPRVVAEIQYVIPQHLLFGIGPSSVNETIILARHMSDPGPSHNFIVGMLTQLGFLGFAAYIGLFWKIIRETISKIHTQELLMIPLMLILTAIFNGIGEIIYSERLFWNALSLAALCLVTFSKANVQLESDDSSEATTLIQGSKIYNA